MLDKDKSEFGGWWIFIAVLLALTVAVFTALRFYGVAAERLIFEQSYQRSSAQDAKRLTLEAELASINSLLLGSSLTAEQRADAQAAKAAINLQLDAMQ